MIELSPDQEKLISEALANAKTTCELRDEKPTGADIILQCLRDMVEIEKKQRVRDRSPKGYSSYWPDVLHDAEETAEIIKQRRIDEAAGDPIEIVYGIRTAATPHNIAVAECVNEVFRRLLVARTPDRDWKILNYLARGRGAKSIARQLGCSRQLVYERRDLQLSAIAAKLRHLMPKDDAPAVSRLLAA